MDLDKDDLAALCEGMTKDQVDRVHRLLHEWNVGPDSSFPVQLALLTCAQWRAAAHLPNVIRNSGKLIESHLAECRQHTAAIVTNLSTVTEDSAAELKSIVEIHTDTVNKASVSIRNQLWETEEVAKRIRTTLENSFGEWEKAEDNFAAERQKLEKERKELAARVHFRDNVYAGIILFGAIALGMLLEYYWKH
jgi:hypothetical protein